MNKKTRPNEKWDYASLKWIHRARAQIYKAEKKQPLTEITPHLSPDAAALARRLKLKTIVLQNYPNGVATTVSRPDHKTPSFLASCSSPTSSITRPTFSLTS